MLVPMRSTFRPLALSAGVIAMYAIVLLMVSSWSRSKLSTRLWRTIHLVAVPAFVLALLMRLRGDRHPATVDDRAVRTTGS